MAFDQKGLNDYIDVAARLAEFRAKHPDGSLQPVDPARPFTPMEIGGQMFIVYAAAAYRTPDDPRPGIGCAYELFPGRTPYTKGSELQNAETSAWGRAIVAALAADTKKGVASMEEVRNRQAERSLPPQQTDKHWLAGIEQRIADATDGQQLAELAGEIRRVEAEGCCEQADRDRLNAAGKKRQDELGLSPRPTNKNGSTSRSRASDEQLAANGEMTRQQLKEHNAMVRDTYSNPKLAARSNGPDPDDPWATIPPGGDDPWAET